MDQQKTDINTQPLRDVFNAILADLERTERKSWGAQDPTAKQALEIAMQIKLSSYKKLVDLQLAVIEGQDLNALVLQAILPTVSPAPVEVDDTPYEPCDFCDGQGGSDIEVGGIEGWVPCVACDGSGKVPVEDEGGA